MHHDLICLGTILNILLGIGMWLAGAAKDKVPWSVVKGVSSTQSCTEI